MYILEYYQSVIRRKERSLLWGTPRIKRILERPGFSWIYLVGVPSERLTLRMLSPQKKTPKSLFHDSNFWIFTSLKTPSKESVRIFSFVAFFGNQPIIFLNHIQFQMLYQTLL